MDLLHALRWFWRLEAVWEWVHDGERGPCPTPAPAPWKCITLFVRTVTDDQWPSLDHVLCRWAMACAPRTPASATPSGYRVPFESSVGLIWAHRYARTHRMILKGGFVHVVATPLHRVEHDVMTRQRPRWVRLYAARTRRLTHRETRGLVHRWARRHPAPRVPDAPLRPTAARVARHTWLPFAERGRRIKRLLHEGYSAADIKRAWKPAFCRRYVRTKGASQAQGEWRSVERYIDSSVAFLKPIVQQSQQDTRVFMTLDFARPGTTPVPRSAARAPSSRRRKS